jgi:hypothetical protein
VQPPCQLQVGGSGRGGSAARRRSRHRCHGFAVSGDDLTRPEETADPAVAPLSGHTSPCSDSPRADASYARWCMAQVGVSLLHRRALRNCARRGCPPASRPRVTYQRRDALHAHYAREAYDNQMGEDAVWRASSRRASAALPLRVRSALRHSIFVQRWRAAGHGVSSTHHRGTTVDRAITTTNPATDHRAS